MFFLFFPHSFSASKHCFKNDCLLLWYLLPYGKGRLSFQKFKNRLSFVYRNDALLFCISLSVSVSLPFSPTPSLSLLVEDVDASFSLLATGRIARRVD